MRSKKEFIISPTIQPNLRQLQHNEARDVLKTLGYSFIHVDDDGMVNAVDPEGKIIENHRLYVKHVPEVMIRES